MFKNSATQAAGYVRSATELFSSSASFFRSKPPPPPLARVPVAAIESPPASPPAWKRWAPAAFAVGGALLAGAAAGTAYYKRDEIGVGYTWATDHMKYVGNLWDEDALRRRLDNLFEIEEKLGVMFRTYADLASSLSPALPMRLELIAYIDVLGSTLTSHRLRLYTRPQEHL